MGSADDDELFTPAKRRRAIDELFRMGTGQAATKVSDQARVRALEQWAKLGDEHWEQRSRVDDDDVVMELLMRMDVADLHDLMIQASDLRAAEDEAP